MNILVVNGFGLSKESLSKFESYKKQISSIFNEIKIPGLQENLLFYHKNLVDLDEFLAFDGSNKFNCLDIILVDISEKILPWSKLGKKLLILCKLAIENNKYILCTNMGLYYFIYLQITNNQIDSNIVNTKTHPTLDQFKNLDINLVKNIGRNDYFLDYSSGDIFDFSKESCQFSPKVNIGFHNRYIAERKFSNYLKNDRLEINHNNDVNDNIVTSKRPFIPNSKSINKSTTYLTLGTEKSCMINNFYHHHFIVKNLLNQVQLEINTEWIPHYLSIKSSKLSNFSRESKILLNNEYGPVLIQLNNCFAGNYKTSVKVHDSITILSNFIIEIVNLIYGDGNKGNLIEGNKFTVISKGFQEEHFNKIVSSLTTGEISSIVTGKRNFKLQVEKVIEEPKMSREELAISKRNTFQKSHVVFEKLELAKKIESNKEKMKSIAQDSHKNSTLNKYPNKSLSTNQIASKFGLLYNEIGEDQYKSIKPVKVVKFDSTLNESNNNIILKQNNINVENVLKEILEKSILSNKTKTTYSNGGIDSGMFERLLKKFNLYEYLSPDFRANLNEEISQINMNVSNKNFKNIDKQDLRKSFTSYSRLNDNDNSFFPKLNVEQYYNEIKNKLIYNKEIDKTTDVCDTNNSTLTTKKSFVKYKDNNDELLNVDLNSKDNNSSKLGILANKIENEQSIIKENSHNKTHCHSSIKEEDDINYNYYFLTPRGKQNIQFENHKIQNSQVRNNVDTYSSLFPYVSKSKIVSSKPIYLTGLTKEEKYYYKEKEKELNLNQTNQIRVSYDSKDIVKLKPQPKYFKIKTKSSLNSLKS